MPIAEVTMYAVPTHAKLSNALNSPVIVGRAVAMMEVSSEASMVASASAPRTSPSRARENPGTIDSVAMRVTVVLFVLSKYHRSGAGS